MIASMRLRRTFQFTTSRGGRRSGITDFWNKLHLSIHDLTRRSTASHGADGRFRGLSIHDLTRRSTALDDMLSIFFSFQFTTSRGGRQIDKVAEWLKGDFQFTTSRGGRHRSGAGYQHSVVFQFTTSRGGRLSIYISRDTDILLSIHDLTRRSTRMHSR